MKITKAEALRLLKNAVERRGDDYVYPPAQRGDNCVYFASNGKPGCIVGDILANDFGVKYKDAKPWNDGGIEDMLTGLGIDFNVSGYNALRVAQTTQDSGKTWGTALREARLSRPVQFITDFIEDHKRLAKEKEKV